MRIARTPLPRILLAAGLALVTWAYARSQLASGHDASREPVEVPVVARSVEAGTALTAEDVTFTGRTPDVIPRDRVAEKPVGRTAAVDLAPGEVLLERRLGRPGLAALLPAGTRGLTVPRAAGTPPLERGQRADVVAGGRVVVAGALVVHADEDGATVAVPADVAPAVADAVANGVVVLALAG